MAKSIILEGSDHTGKTTLANLIYKMTGWEIRHMTKPGSTFQYFEDYYAQHKHGVIYDRFHLGALIYGRILALHPTFGWNKEEFIALCERLTIRETPTVILYFSNDADLGSALELSPKEELFNRSVILAANRCYRDIPGLAYYTHDISIHGYPTERDVEEWIYAKQ